MFKLGEYDEFEAVEIADYLKEAGVKVDLKPSICALMESALYLEGRASQLRERIGDFEVYDRYIEALKTLLSEGVEDEEFVDRYLSLLNPSWNGSMEDIFEDVSNIVKKSRESTSSGIKQASTILTNLLGAAEALQFLDAALELNEIEIEGGAGGELGDDPLLRISVDPDDCDLEDELIKSILAVRLEKMVEVRLDELTTPLARDVDDEFAEEYPEEYYKIAAMGMTVERLIEPPGDSNKVDLDEFRDLLAFEEDMDDFVMMVDGTAVAEDIAKTLKKEGVIKIKGDKIAWKK
jgi:hypothetical protein